MWLSHSFFIYHRGKACRDVHWMPSSCQPLCLPVTYHVSFTSHRFSVCVDVCIWVCRCSCPCVHMQKSEEDIGYLQDKVSHCTRSLTILAWLPGQLTPDIWLSPLHNAEVTGTWSCAQIFNFIFLWILDFIFSFYWKSSFLI